MDTPTPGAYETGPMPQPAQAPVYIYPALLVGVLSHVYLTDGRMERRLRANAWNEVRVTPAARIGYVNKSLDAVSIARKNGVPLPPLSRAVVYRPHWFQPVVFSGTAEPYNADDRSLRGRLRRVPPPPPS